MNNSAQMTAIGDITTWHSGGTPSRARSDYWSGDIPWISAFTLKDAEINTSDQFLTPEAVAAGSKMAPLGSTLLLVRGSALHNVIRAGMVTSPVAFNQDVKALVPKRGIVPKYLTHVIRGNEHELLKLVTSSGNTAGVLDTNVVQAFEIYLPNEHDQRRLVEAFDDVDKLITTLERLIAKKLAIKQGMIQQLITGNARIPGFTDGWLHVRLRDAGYTYGGLTGKNKEHFGHGSARFVTFTEVMEGPRLRGLRLEPVVVGPGERQNRVCGGDVLFNGSSETPDEVALAAAVDFDPIHETYLNSFCFGYRVKRSDLIDPTFLAIYFRSATGRELVASLAQGATRYNIAKTKFLELAPELPPVEEQRAIATVFVDTDNETDALHSRLSKARAIKQGMMQQLLTGRARLSAGVVS